MVWRETGAVRNVRPSRGQAAFHPEEGEVGKRRAQPPLENDGPSLALGSQHTAGTHGDPLRSARGIFD